MVHINTITVNPNLGCLFGLVGECESEEGRVCLQTGILEISQVRDVSHQVMMSGQGSPLASPGS